MSEVTISTSGIIREVDANIDGHVYKVRKLGAGDQLDIQVKTSKITLVSKKAFNLKSKAEALKENGTDEKVTMELADQISEMMQELEEAQNDIAKCWLKLFDDGTPNQAHSQALLEKYGVEGLQILQKRIFDPALKKPEESDAKST